MASARSDARWQALLSPHLDYAAQSLRLLCDSDAALWAGKSPSALWPCCSSACTHVWFV